MELQPSEPEKRVQKQNHTHIFNLSYKGEKAIKWRKGKFFQQIFFEQLDIHIQESLNTNCTPYTKIDSKWITDLSDNEKLKLFEENRKNSNDLEFAGF